MTVAIDPTSVHPQEITVSAGVGPSEYDVPWVDYTPIEPDLHPHDVPQIFRHTGWAPLRKRVLRAMYLAHAKPKRLRRFARCGADAYVMKDVTQVDRYKVVASYCHDRFCTPCARERSRQLAAAVMNRSKHLKLRFITLTIRATRADLTETVDKVLQSFKKLRTWIGWKRAVRGGVAFVETKYNEQTESWHTHLHVLVDSDYMPQAVLAYQWERATGDSHIVDIRWAGSSERVARYVTKYVAKPLHSSFQFDDGLLQEAVAALSGRRLALQFGDWRGMPLGEADKEGGWEVLCSLTELVRNAAQRDKAAMDVLACLHCDDFATLLDAAAKENPPRAPPACPPSAEQPLLFPTNATYYL